MYNKSTSTYDDGYDRYEYLFIAWNYYKDHVFDHLDLDGSGTLTREEFDDPIHDLLFNIQSPFDFIELFESFDANGNGKIGKKGNDIFILLV